MKKFVKVVAASALALSLGVTGVMAEASAKATASISNITILEGVPSYNNVDGQTDGNTTQGWTTILENTIKTANNKDLFIDASLECGLYTDTEVKSKGGTKDTSVATASVKVQVVIDEGTANQRIVEPGEVVFCRRSQTLSAVFQGLLEDEDGNVCLSADPDSGAITIDEECLQPEEVQLVLDTMNANSFNFIAADVSQGTHTISVQAKIAAGTDAQEGSAEARASIGKGSVTIESVRMVKDEVIDFNL